ncbi:MAG: ligase-associated DNA damage response DEXH box helicase [Candidatus Sumerlaeia bacterium]|nr:ligase-associated DNA damage response DEXH box helicase [Candidatus Sumerlaeia bacterium]
MPHAHPHAPLRRWFSDRGWKPAQFQEEAWASYLAGESGLVHAPTGLGKTLAVWGGPLLEALAAEENDGLRALWITPLRALAANTVASLREALAAFGLDLAVELRTGDVSSAKKARQRERPPFCLVTTPESLSLLLSYADTAESLRRLRCVVVDEWHELLGSKRGVQTELCLARLRALAPGLRTWGLSATLGNLDEARDALLGAVSGAGRLVSAEAPKEIAIETLLPDEMERFPWAGHLGLKLLPRVVEAVERASSTLLFTNTRSQAELWFNAFLALRPDWEPRLGLHHGSLDRELREQAERGIDSGALRCVVCTSSLDLGVDFAPVEQVIQIGSPKGIARLLQRAGRSGHRPGAPSRVLCVPTNALELVEFSAARAAAEARRIESRAPITGPLDVLAQHVVTLALAGGVAPEAALAEARATRAYASLTGEQWGWVLDFLKHGGRALGAYPQYRRIVEREGRLVPAGDRVARAHRMAVGTIASDAAVSVRFQNGATLGSIEESFAAWIKPGDRFLFAGRVVECVRFREMAMDVKRAAAATRSVPKWMGGRMPLSTQLADAVRARFHEAARGEHADAEMRAVAPLLELQERWSKIPLPHETLIERTRSREGHHAYVFAFAGRLAHEGMAALAAFRIARRAPITFTTCANDYGFELVSRKPFPLGEEEWRAALSPGALLEDLLACLNGTELAKRKFREVARVAGLVSTGFPGQSKSAKQVQMSSGLLYDVFAQFDPENLLLHQARREVLDEQLEVTRLRAALERVAAGPLVLRETERLTPLSFPLWAERIRESVSSESWAERLERMVAELAEAAESGWQAMPKRKPESG